jgi:hypothetical protein
MQYFAEGRDLEYLNEQTKVVWACSPPLFLFKPRDYCTIVHYRKESDGTIIGTSDVSHPHQKGLISACFYVAWFGTWPGFLPTAPLTHMPESLGPCAYPPSRNRR